MNTPLTEQDLNAARAALTGWTIAPDALTKTFQFASFREAMSFMVRVGFEAEALDHHPEWTNVYNRVTIKLNTHSAGGKVTGLDVELATRIQSVSWVK